MFNIYQFEKQASRDPKLPTNASSKAQIKEQADPQAIRRRKSESSKYSDPSAFVKPCESHAEMSSCVD